MRRAWFESKCLGGGSFYPFFSIVVLTDGQNQNATSRLLSIRISLSLSVFAILCMSHLAQ